MKRFYLVFAGIQFLISCGGAKLPSYLQEEYDKEILEAKKNEEKKKENTLDPIQVKYGKIIKVAPKEITNVKLYKFIDSWMETPYLMGGENRRGIDCSYFSQFLYHDVYDSLIERTAEKQYSAPGTHKFKGQEFLQEGDLLFFNLEGSLYAPISHVGVYLKNGMFVHSTSRKTKKGNNGVQISNLKDAHWQRIFVAAGRKAEPKK